MKRIEYLPNQLLNGITFLKEVASYIDPKSRIIYRKALFECYCGKEFQAQIISVRRKNTKSCGCYRRQKMKETKTTHGLSRYPLYHIRAAMLQRCYNKSDKNYKYYGARDIIVCNEWINACESFIEWALENGWQKGLTVDRINNDGNYEPSNCRFVTQAENNKNKRKPYKKNDNLLS